jgi:hypothetical protein
LAFCVGFEFAMIDDRTVQRKKLREELAELKTVALAELECRGYEVRGKTPGQIRQLLKRRPSTQKAEGLGPKKTATDAIALRLPA